MSPQLYFLVILNFLPPLFERYIFTELCRRNGGLLIFFLVHVLFVQSHAQEKQSNYASPSKYTIGGITTSGLQYLDQDIIISLSGLKAGDEIAIPGDAISNAIRNLWEQNLFTDIQIYVTKTIGSNVFLEIALKEKARLSRFMLRGIKKGESDDLREKIKLVKGRVVNENTKITTANIIRNYYREKGYLNAVVTIREIPDTLLTNSVLLDILIDKGSKVKIGSIRFEGNEVISSKKLKKLMKDTREKAKFDLKAMLNRKNIKQAIPDSVSFFRMLGNLSPSQAYRYISNYTNLNIFKSSKFIPDKYKDDKDKIIEYYNSKGYRDAEIVNDTVYMFRNHLKIDIQVDEGRQYFFRNITWKGNTKYTNTYLSSILNIRKGQVYNQDLLDERLNMSPSGNDVSSLYMDDGYLFFQITPVEINIENDSIDLEIRIYEGPQATINEVRIYGNTKTKEYVIRRELR
ncbi:MAG TPA: POTRA domain-containing protein, partial [Chitinophagales bacterium]|nr:POTRA domain-containing protein [Chitinophagales bacterium]